MTLTPAQLEGKTMETKFTPGPWKIRGPQQEQEGYNYQVHTKEFGVAKLQWFSDRPQDAEIQKANAHVIAAAPELYAALEKIFTSTWPKECPPDWCDMMRAALSKARGEQ